MKNIGFIDYYLSEWHANHYPPILKELSQCEFALAYAYAELDISPVDGVSSLEWCEKNGAVLCQSIEELCEKSDVIVILAPSDPDRHLELAKKALPYGKPTYIDKTFAPDLETAKKIFAIAKEHGTPFFSSSALRFATELEAPSSCTHIVTTGSGRSVEEYIIHQIEMVVKKLGVGAQAVKADLSGSTYTFHVRYADDRNALMLYGPLPMPFTAYMAEQDGKGELAQISSDFFRVMLSDMLRFFKEKTVSFDIAETLEVMRIRDGVLTATKCPQDWITLA